MGIDPEFSADEGRLQGASLKRPLAKACERILGRKVNIRLQSLSSEDWQRLNGNAGSPQRAKNLPKNTIAERKLWVKDPSVLRIIESFNGTIEEIR